MAAKLKMLFLTAAAFALLALAIVKAWGAESEPAGRVLSKKETAVYLQAALKHSRYASAKGLPVIEIVPQKELWDEVCGGEPCPIGGLFDIANPHRVRVIAEQPAIELKRSIVHEIVHWLQFQKGLLQNRPTCADARAREAEAYTAAYLYAVTELGYTRAFWYPLAPCPSDIGA